MMEKSKSSNTQVHKAISPLLLSAFCLLFLVACGKRLPVAASGDVEGGVPRRAAIELFTATWCTNCPAADQAVEELAADLGDSITIIEYHPTFNAPQDPFGTAQTDQRFSFYGVSAPPVFICDGVARVAGAVPNLLSEYRSAAAGQLGKKSPVVIDLSGGLQSANINYQVRVESVVDRALENLRLLLVVSEDSISFNAPNGVVLHRYVARDFEPDPQGYEVDLIPLGYESYGGTLSLNPSWNQQRLRLTALLQDQSSNEILQSVSIKLLANLYSLNIKAQDTLKIGQPGVFTEFPFILFNKGNAGDSIIIDLPDSLAIPDSLVRTLCNQQSCFPLPHTVFIAANDSIIGFKVDIMPSKSGRSTAVLTATPQSSPSSSVAARFHVEVP